MIGRVRLKSKSAAFSISSAREGGAKESDVAAMRERDLRVEVERERNWGFLRIVGVRVRVRVLGMENLGVLVEAMEGGAERGLEEAIITFAMAASSFGALELRVNGNGGSGE